MRQLGDTRQVANDSMRAESPIQEPESKDTQVKF